MKQIGKGKFTTAYLLDTNKVLLKTTDPIKEAMALGFFPESSYFAKVDFDCTNQHYIMEYLPRPRSLKKSLKPLHWNQYKYLVALYKKEATNAVKKPYPINYWVSLFQQIPWKRLRQALIEAATACSNYSSDTLFEISPCNVTVKNKQLILLDCFFIYKD